MQVVVLAAGRGERFISNGVSTPKLLLRLGAGGRSMFNNALNQAAEISHEPVVVCMEHLQRELSLQAPSNVEPIYSLIRFTQQGAAMSLLSAHGLLRDEDPVLILDCDTIYAPGVLSRFNTFSSLAFGEHGYDSTVLCFKPKELSARYSFVKTSGKGKFPLVTHVVEKVAISDTATCGVHAFASWERARQSIYEMVILSTKTNNEYYLAPTHNNLNKTAAMLITPSEFTHVGTPDELADYQLAVGGAL